MELSLRTMQRKITYADGDGRERKVAVLSAIVSNKQKHTQQETKADVAGGGAGSTSAIVKKVSFQECADRSGHTNSTMPFQSEAKEESKPRA